LNLQKAVLGAESFDAKSAPNLVFLLRRVEKFQVFDDPLGWWCEQVRLHVNFAQFRQTAAQLQERLHSLQDAHMGEANLLDEFKFRMFRERRNLLSHPEHSAYDVV
jgi:hypothetical protein